MWNALDDNKFVQLFCCYCNAYLADLNTKYKTNIISITCPECSKVNYFSNWIIKPITRNPEHPENVAMYFNKNMK